MDSTQYRIFTCKPSDTLHVARAAFNAGFKAYAPRHYEWTRRRHGPPKREIAPVLPGFLFCDLLHADRLQPWGRSPAHRCAPMHVNGHHADVALRELYLIQHPDDRAPMPQAPELSFGVGQQVHVTHGPFATLDVVVLDVKKGLCAVAVPHNGLRLEISTCQLRSGWCNGGT